jgi:hypothetical protein
MLANTVADTSWHLMTLSLILAETVADTCLHCRWYLLTLYDTVAGTCWHCRWYLLTLSLILADTWWHCSSFKLQISGSDSRFDGSSLPIGWHFSVFRISRVLFSTDACCPTRGFEILLCPFIGTSITAFPVLNLLKTAVVWDVIEIYRLVRNLLPSPLRHNVSRRLL